MWGHEDTRVWTDLKGVVNRKVFAAHIPELVHQLLVFGRLVGAVVDDHVVTIFGVRVVEELDRTFERFARLRGHSDHRIGGHETSAAYSGKLFDGFVLMCHRIEDLLPTKKWSLSDQRPDSHLKVMSVRSDV